MNAKASKKESRKKRAREVGKRIESRIVAKGLSQTGLARQIGMSQSQLNGYVQGKNIPSGPILKKLANALGVTIEWLTTGQGAEVWEHGEVFKTRKVFWDEHIRAIIRESERFVFFDSYLTQWHVFTDALRERLLAAAPFELIILILREDDQFLQECLSAMEIAPINPVADSIGRIRSLAKSARAHGANEKVVAAYYWKGISPGPLISWTKGGKQTICLGLWLNNPAATDGTPYLCVTGGYLFEALKGHYEAHIEQAGKANRVIDLND